MPMDEDNGDDHVGGDAERGYAAEESDYETDASKEFGGNSQNRQHCGDVHLLGKETQRGPETEPAEPAQGLLRAMHKKYSAKREPKQGHHEIVRSVHELLKHGRLLLFQFSAKGTWFPENTISFPLF